MFRAEVDINKKDYLWCSMFYIRKYLSLRELILLGVLLFAGLLFWFTLENILILIMFLVVLVLMGFAVVLFITTAIAGYASDYAKRGIVKHIFTFDKQGFDCESIDKNGERVFKERIDFKNVEKAALRKDRVYIYAGVAMPFYFFPEHITQGDYQEFRLFLIDHIDKSKFKMKTKFRSFPHYPKRKFDQDLAEKIDKIDYNQPEDNQKY